MELECMRSPQCTNIHESPDAAAAAKTELPYRSHQGWVSGIWILGITAKSEEKGLTVAILAKASTLALDMAQCRTAL
jgi:hypothetical protein